ncbi:DUF1775 domain-containing protein [Pseudarthrobacter sp. NamE2]|uniref:YcnI family copper-binding membrane protein n=1 Tax=Pseudarthrobacter sp. NamE2 TaxID=2576838 RepID=UPI0010FD4F58|nr:YcnI family protein [Pseudarthrobacter sp. NamE2]TLM81067.1 DUF1775 domain-containing protein [Pseudarthrobacter sp. NamE2]
MNTLRRRTLDTIAATTLAAGLITLGAGAASAHVRVDPDGTSEGSYTQLTFRVPNESETAKTNKLEVSLPTQTPFSSVSVKPLDGWKAEVVISELPEPVTVNGATVTKAPTSVIWTADETHQIGPHEYQTFSISVGVLPTAGTELILPASQTYTDGNTVKWDQGATEGQAEPKYPAPAFTTTAKSNGHSHGGATTPPATVPAAAASSTSPANDAGATAGWLGLATGLIGLTTGFIALARTRSHRVE